MNVPAQVDPAHETPAVQAGRHVSAGLAHARTGSYEAAIIEFTAALALNARLADALANRGEAQRRLGRVAEAIVDFSAALHIDPRHWLALENRAIAQRSVGRLRDAIADANRLVRHDRGDPRYWGILGECQRRSGNLPRARECLERALALPGPQGPGAAGNLALVLWQLGDPGCIEAFDSAIAQFPDDYWLHAQRAGCLRQLGHPAEGLRGYARALRCDPSRTWVYVARALLLNQMGRPAQAARDFAIVLGSDPARPGAAAWMGEVELRGGRFERAMAWFDQALRAEDTEAHGFARTRRAKCLLELGQAERAKTELKALASAPLGSGDEAETQAEALLLLGRELEAARALARAMQRDLQLALRIEDNVLLRPLVAVASIGARLQEARARAAKIRLPGA